MIHWQLLPKQQHQQTLCTCTHPTSDVALVPHNASLRAAHPPLACAGSLPHFDVTHCTYTGMALRDAPSLSAVVCVSVRISQGARGRRRKHMQDCIDCGEGAARMEGFTSSCIHQSMRACLRCWGCTTMQFREGSSIACNCLGAWVCVYCVALSLSMLLCTHLAVPVLHAMLHAMPR